VQPQTADAASDSGLPDWAEPDFQALLFQVARLNLAVPLVKLHSVVPWEDAAVSAMPNQPPWCHGVFRYRDRNVTVIDTGRLVLPDDRREELEAQEAEPEKILIVGDGRWGLACRTVGEVVRLTPDEVKWRSGGGKRPWLAGTVLGRLCALMDTEAFAAMLERGWGK
jgi:purine-binding chemotaxis protein CheW